MVKICITHYSLKTIKSTTKILCRYKSHENIEFSLIVGESHELEYIIRHRDMDIFIIEADYVRNDYDGIYLAKRIKIFNRMSLIIFVAESMENDFLIRLINSEPFAYINNQNIMVELPKVLDKAISILTKISPTLTYFKRNEKFFVQLNNVVYFTSEHRVIRFIYINGDSDEFYEKMDNMENIISKMSDQFVRINQSYLINQNQILSFKNDEVTMTNGDVIRISRKYHHNFELIRNMKKDI